MNRTNKDLGTWTMDQWLSESRGWRRKREVDGVKRVKYKGVGEDEMGKGDQIYGS